MPFLKITFEDKYIRLPANNPRIKLTLEEINIMSKDDLEIFVSGYMVYWQDEPMIKSFEVVDSDNE